MKLIPILFLWLASCILSLGAGALNGVAVTHWNGIAFTAWNGSGVSAAGGGGGGGTRWITNATPLNSTSNGYAGYIGGKFTVGGANITVTHLAVYVIAGSTQTHAVKIWDDSGTDTVLASGSIDYSLYSNEWATVLLSPSWTGITATTYRIGVQQFSGGDSWHEGAGSTYTVTGVATLDGYYYGTTFPEAGTSSANNIYAPVSFIYSAP